MFRGLRSIIYKESIHVLRDPRTLFLMLLIPGFQLTIFGYAIQLDVDHIETTVYNLDGRPPSVELIEEFRNTGTFDIVGYAFSEDELLDAIVAGKSKVGLKIPPDYTDALVRGEATQLQMLVDGSHSSISMRALNVGSAVAMRKSVELVTEEVGGPRQLPVDFRPRVLFNPDMRTANFMVPGLVGIVMQLVTMFLTGLAVVKEKEGGTLEQLMVTPVSRMGLMVGKLVPYGVVGTFETTIVLLIMRYLFDVPIRGSLLELSVFALVFLFTSLGLGLLVSAIASNQMEAVQLAFLIVLPSVLLSGFMFPQEPMPRPIYYAAQLLPATYFIRILRGIILRGADFWDLWQEGMWLAVIGVTVLVVASTRFRKTLG